MTPSPPIVMMFVINPISGGIQKNNYEEVIKKYFSRCRHTISFFLMKGKNDASELEKCIGKEKPQTVVAVGGDGTVNMVAKLLLGTDMKLGILPAGSANGLARELNIPLNITDALRILEKNNVRKIDCLSINNKICLHLSDIGLNARLIKYFEEGNLRGKLGYAKVVLKAFFRRQYMRVIIYCDDQEIKRDAFMVVLANASKYGTGVTVNPNGNVFDGFFEVVIIRKIGFTTLLKMWLKPKSFDPKKIEVIQATSVNIQTYRRVHFQIDGEYLGKLRRVNAHILPAQLNILIPG